MPNSNKNKRPAQEQRSGKRRQPRKGKVRPEDTAEFLSAIFKSRDLIELRCIEKSADKGQKKGKLPHRDWVRRDDILEDEQLRDLNRQGINIYFGVCPRPAENTGKAEDIETVRCLWADVDHCTIEEVQRRIFEAGLPQPSILVNSGHGAHLYWLLPRPFKITGDEDRARVTRLHKAIYAKLEADHTQDLSRLLRPSRLPQREGPSKCGTLHTG